MNIHFFNPGHETAVLNQSPYYMAPANVVAMQRELAMLPIWYANAEDGVFVWNEEDTKYRQYLADMFKDFPRIYSKDDITDISAKLHLWGVSPQAIHFWNELNLSSDANIDVPKWREEYFSLTGRQMAEKCLVYIQQNIVEIENDLTPHFCESLSEIEELVANSPCQLLAKAPYSSSGRGLLWLPIGELTRTERQILHGILKKQGSVSIEKALDKQIDFAMEFISDGVENVSFAGYSLFETNAKGAYSANILDTQQAILEDLTDNIEISQLDHVRDNIISFLSKEYANLYEGCIGVDMMIYRSEIGEYKLHPCVEINMRYNMGYLALQFAKRYLHHGAKGRFYIDFSPKEAEIFSRHQQLSLERPTEYSDQKITRGYIALCPVYTNSHYWAYVLID